MSDREVKDINDIIDSIYDKEDSRLTKIEERLLEIENNNSKNKSK